jgi:transposase
MNRKRYSVEFKKEAARLLIMEGMSAPEVSKKLGVSANMLYRWKSVYLKELGGDAEAGKGASPAEMADEIQRLNKALGREKRINEILKKTVSYFSEDEL